MTEMTTPEVFTTNIVFVNKHSSYKNKTLEYLAVAAKE